MANTSVISKVFFTIEKGKEKTSEIVFTIPSVGVKIRFVFTLKNTPIAVMNIVIIKQITLKYKLNDNVGIIKSYKSVNQPKVLASGEISHLLSGENDQSQSDRNNQCISFSFL